MAKEQKVYMPLMIGDWLKGTRGMKAEVRGVYLGLLLFQWDNGFIPSDMEELCLIDPEVPKVWDKIKSKFIEIAPGKLQNKKNLEVKEFWAKQKKNGENGGRPKKSNPKENLTRNPNTNPKPNLHIDLDIDNELELKIKKELRENASRETPPIDFSMPDVEGDDLIFPIDTKPVRDLWAAWKKKRFEKYNLRYGMMSEQADLKRLEGMNFNQIQETILAAISGEWKNLYPDKRNGKTNGSASTNKKQQQMDDIKHTVASTYAGVFAKSQRKPDG